MWSNSSALIRGEPLDAIFAIDLANQPRELRAEIRGNVGVRDAERPATINTGESMTDDRVSVRIPHASTARCVGFARAFIRALLHARCNNRRCVS